VKRYLPAAAAVSILAVSGCLCALILTVRSTVAAVPPQITAARADLTAQMNALRRDGLAEIEVQGKAFRRTGVNQLAVIRKDALAEIDATRSGLLQRADHVTDRVDDQLSTLNDRVAPVLANAASIEAHADEGVAILARRDALPAQVLGLIAASKVTAGETAQTMKALRDAAPQFIATGAVTNTQIAGVVTDLHTLTTKFTRPLTLKQKIWEGFKATALLLGHLI